MLNLFVSIIVLGMIAFILFWFFKNRKKMLREPNKRMAIRKSVWKSWEDILQKPLSSKKSQPARIIFDRKDPSPCLDQIVFPDFECMQISYGRAICG